MLKMSPCICKYTKKYVFCWNFGNMRKNNVFCRKLVNTHPIKEGIAFVKSLPTSATLILNVDPFLCTYELLNK